MGFVVFGLFLLFVIMGMPIAICLGLSSIITMIFYDMTLAAFPSIIYSGTGKFSLLAIPFFVLAGIIMEYAGISRRLIVFARTFVGHIRSGLAIVTVVVSAFFAAISGSGPATVASLGPILVPAMKDAGYDKGWSAALIANAGNMGIIIPPSIVLVIYGVLAEVSITKLFIAGIIPGIIFGAALCIMALISLSKKKDIMVKTKASLRAKLKAAIDAFWGLMSPIIILGGIYCGVVTPTEAAGLAAVYGLFVGIFIYKEIKLKDFRKIFVDASISSASVMFIVANASLFSWLLTSSGIATNIANSMIALTSNKIIILLLINIMLLVAGCFVDAASALYIFIPILLPVLKILDVNLVAFGIFATMNLAIGMATPPVGVNLFVACNVSNVSLSEISQQTLRFLLVSLIVLLLVTYIPQISLFLPEMMGL